MTHHDPTFWLLARASGITAYVMLTLSVLAGLVLKSRPFARLRAATVAEVHKTLALTGLGALMLHAISLVLDTTVKVSVPGLLIPVNGSRALAFTAWPAHARSRALRSPNAWRFAAFITPRLRRNRSFG